MRAILFAVVAAFALSSANAGDWVNGYTRKDGTYVQGHYRASPDEYRWNNPSSQSMGGSLRDEFSSPSRYNRSNPLYAPHLDQNRNGTYDSDER